MALLMGALYDALRHAPGITEEAARLAADEVANENGIRRIEHGLKLLKWMVGASIALALILLGLLFVLATKLPAA